MHAPLSGPYPERELLHATADIHRRLHAAIAEFEVAEDAAPAEALALIAYALATFLRDVCRGVLVHDPEKLPALLEMLDGLRDDVLPPRSATASRLH